MELVHSCLCNSCRASALDSPGFWRSFHDTSVHAFSLPVHFVTSCAVQVSERLQVMVTQVAVDCRPRHNSAGEMPTEGSVHSSQNCVRCFAFCLTRTKPPFPAVTGLGTLEVIAGRLEAAAAALPCSPPL